MKSRQLQLFYDSLSEFKTLILFFLVIESMNIVIFYLYNISLEPFFYSLLLGTIFLLVSFLFTFFRSIREGNKRERMKSGIMSETLPQKGVNLTESDYLEMLNAIKERLLAANSKFESEKQLTDDYITAWVHQIKTPISVIRLMINVDENPEHRMILSEIFKIEQYVDMILTYARLGSNTNDLVLEEYKLDDLIREIIRKYASQFIYKKIQMNYKTVEDTIITDRKWFCCILDQLISNSIKYTVEGSVTISVQNNAVVISDTGIGIAKEDIPMIFQKGYTGINGRISQKSSGLGLYLASRAADLLQISLSVFSEKGKGSEFRICYKKPES